MNHYLQYLQNKFKRFPFGIQGILWFISFKFSMHILQGLEEIPTSLFTLILQFFLSIVILTMGLAFFDFVFNRNRNFNN